MQISGIDIYYYYICKKKLWYFLNEINMEQNNELVSIGKILDENSYKKNQKNIMIDNTINIDFINNNATLHEVKKTKAIEEAGMWQLKYYMYYLKQKGVKNIKAEIDFPLIKETKKIELTVEEEKELENTIKEIEKIYTLRKELNKCNNVSEVMGIEGNIRKIYYSAWNKIIDSNNFEFEKRVKNPPDNAINSLISYVNTIIYTRCLSEIYKTQLNPTISYLHEPSERRFSLCLDVSEIFKPIIADRLIFSMINKKQITEKDFEKNLNYLYIKENARKQITIEIDKKLKTTIKHKKLDRDVSYKYIIRLELYKLIKLLLEGEPYEGFKMWW